MTFVYPYFLGLPLLFGFLTLFRRQIRHSVPYGDVSILEQIPPSLRLRIRTWTLFSLRTLFIVLICAAAARPQKVSQVEPEQKAPNVMLVVDLSRSMETPDFGSAFGQVSRIAGVKKVISEFIRQRQGDRIGLVVFGSSAFVQAPLTMDHELVAEMVEHLQLGSAGDATAIGDGLGLSLKRLREIEGDSRTVILLTDGVNNSGQVNPIKAAQVAQDLHVKVHTIGIGSNATLTRNIGGGMFQQQLMQQAEFDEKTLKQIAEMTGGVYFNAGTVEGLSQVYSQIDKLERTDAEDTTHQIVEELFAPLAQAALLAYLAQLLLARSILQKLP